jgi:hypothetical protein
MGIAQQAQASTRDRRATAGRRPALSRQSWVDTYACQAVPIFLN